MTAPAKAPVQPALWNEIAGLAPLHGYIKQENRVVPAWSELTKKRVVQPESWLGSMKLRIVRSM